MTTTLPAFIAANRLTMTAERTDSNPHMEVESVSMDHWRVTLRCGGRRMTLTFSQGFGHHGAAPELASVLDCLASDSSSVEGNDFESWASDFGYSTDSRKALKTYNVCVRQMRSLGRLLGPDAYSALLWDTERL